jgi:hypothetical protein
MLERFWSGGTKEEHIPMRESDLANDAKKTKTSPLMAGSCSTLLPPGVRSAIEICSGVSSVTTIGTLPDPHSPED